MFGSTKERQWQLKKYSSGLATSFWAAEHSLTLFPQEAAGSWDQFGPKLSGGVPCPGNLAQSIWVGVGFSGATQHWPHTRKPQQAEGTAQLTVSIQGNPVPDTGSQVLRSGVWNTFHSYSGHFQHFSQIKPDQWDSCVDCRLPSITHYKPPSGNLSKDPNVFYRTLILSRCPNTSIKKQAPQARQSWISGEKPNSIYSTVTGKVEICV